MTATDLPIGALVLGLLIFHVIIAVGSPLASKSRWLARFMLGYAYFFSLSAFWFML